MRWYRAPRRPTGPPIVAVEGGPGYPSTGTRAEYRGIFGPLVRQRGMLLVDNRGTGGSALIDCRSVQGYTGRTSGSAFARRAGRCGEFIERKFGRGASALFATAYAVDDLSAVLRALRLRSIDLYGDSYGTFFVQDFVARHPSVLNKVVLDSSYPRSGTDPWYASSGEAFRHALETVSAGLGGAARRSCCSACAAPRSRAGHEMRTGARCRCASTRGGSRTSSRTRRRTRSRCASSTRRSAPPWPATTYRCCGSRASRTPGTTRPPTRTTSRAARTSRSTASTCRSCSTSTPRRRGAARSSQAAVAPEGAFAPFTGAEWQTISGFSQPYDVCLDWPKPLKRPPRLPSVKLPASVPILIAGGDLDSLTPLLDAPVFGPSVGESVEIVNLRNTVHVTSQGGDFLVEGMRCARTVIRSFIRGALDSACAATIPALHTPDYAATPATLVSGPDPGEAARRAASDRRRRPSPTPSSAATTRASTAVPACAAARSPPRTTPTRCATSASRRTPGSAAPGRGTPRPAARTRS